MKTGELVALFGACDATTAQGARDAALLAVLYGAGLRQAEDANREAAETLQLVRWIGWTQHSHELVGGGDEPKSARRPVLGLCQPTSPEVAVSSDGLALRPRRR